MRQGQARQPGARLGLQRRMAQFPAHVQRLLRHLGRLFEAPQAGQGAAQAKQGIGIGARIADFAPDGQGLFEVALRPGIIGGGVEHFAAADQQVLLAPAILRLLHHLQHLAVIFLRPGIIA